MTKREIFIDKNINKKYKLDSRKDVAKTILLLCRETKKINDKINKGKYSKDDVFFYGHLCGQSYALFKVFNITDEELELK